MAVDPSFGSARSIFGTIYKDGVWQFNDGRVPRSGNGSTLSATNTTCAVLLHAVKLMRARQQQDDIGKSTTRREQRRQQQLVRILDLPCGNFTWMPHCLRHIAARVPDITLVYRGVDVVDHLIEQLNDRHGELLGAASGRDHFAMPRGVALLPFLRADVSNATELRGLAGQVDIILSKHMLIHTPNRLIETTLDAWGTLGSRLLVCDNTRTTRLRTYDIGLGGGRDVDLHAQPFNVVPPLCADFDAGLCASERKCRDTIQVHRLPLLRWPKERRPKTPDEKNAVLDAVPSCLRHKS